MKMRRFLVKVNYRRYYVLHSPPSPCEIKTSMKVGAYLLGSFISEEIAVRCENNVNHFYCVLAYCLTARVASLNLLIYVIIVTVILIEININKAVITTASAEINTRVCIAVISFSSVVDLYSRNSACSFDFIYSA